VLPVIGPDGLTPARAYARPFKASGRPRVAIVIGGLGLDPEVTRLAVESLPPEVTLAFSPYAPRLQEWINRARERGHEVLLEVPMEPEPSLRRLFVGWSGFLGGRAAISASPTGWASVS
jgi:hypothetical protein